VNKQPVKSVQRVFLLAVFVFIFFNRLRYNMEPFKINQKMGGDEESLWYFYEFYKYKNILVRGFNQ